MEFVVVSGWTGAGKSTLADALGAALPATVASFDWLMSALRSFPSVWEAAELPVEHQRRVGWELLGRVAEQQLRRGASVVVDLVAREEIVDEWRALADRYGARFAVVECICRDVDVHRSRVDGRVRGIPGWYELDWEHVALGRERYAPLPEPKLVLDAVDPLAANVARALTYLGR